MGEENQPNQNDNPISNAQTSNFNVSSGGSTENKGKKKTVLVIVAILLIVAIVAGLAYYFTSYTKPDQVYKRLVGNTIDNYTNEMKKMDYKTAKTSFKIDADLETDELDKDVIDLINKINLGMDVQTNNEDKQFLMNVKADYDKEDLLELQMYSNVQEEKTYMQLKSFLDKYIEIEDMDDEFYTYFEEILEKQKMSNDQKQSLQKAMNILKKELTNIIKPEYCTAQKEDITVNGKNIATTKNTIKMNTKQVKDEFTTVFTNLKDNEEFINCFEDKDEVSDALENLLDAMDEIDEDEDVTMEIAIYTTGFMQKVQKVTITANSEEDEDTITMTITKTAENTYEYVISEKDDTVCKGNINVEEKNKQEGIIHLEIEIEDAGKLKLNIEYSQKFNEDIDNVDVKDAVTADELTKADQEKLMTNLQKSKLYELIESFSGASTSNLMGSGSNSTKNKTTTNIIDEDDDEDDDADVDEDEKNAKTKDNEIISYDGKTKITFKIPSGYKTNYVSDNYKSVEKGDTAIKVSTSYGDKDKYYKDLQEKKEYFEKEGSDYKNVTLTEPESMEVNGKTFYRSKLSYEYSSGSYTTKFETTYIWSTISDESVVDFEIRDSEGITSQELEEILTINVEKNK